MHRFAVCYVSLSLLIINSTTHRCSNRFNLLRHAIFYVISKIRLFGSLLIIVIGRSFEILNCHTVSQNFDREIDAIKLSFERRKSLPKFEYSYSSVSRVFTRELIYSSPTRLSTRFLAQNVRIRDEYRMARLAVLRRASAHKIRIRVPIRSRP